MLAAISASISTGQPRKPSQPCRRGRGRARHPALHWRGHPEGLCGGVVCRLGDRKKAGGQRRPRAARASSRSSGSGWLSRPLSGRWSGCITRRPCSRSPAARWSCAMPGARRGSRESAMQRAAEPRCRAALTRLPDGDAEQLEHWQALEEEIGAFDYDVWACACGYRQLFRYDGVSPRAECAACHHHTTTRRRVVIRDATESHTPPTLSEHLSRHEARSARFCAARFANAKSSIMPRAPSAPPTSRSSPRKMWSAGE